MRSRTATVLLAALLVAAAWAAGHAQTQLADFKLTVEPTATGAKLTCLKGCSWSTLSFKCPTPNACKGEVDNSGVGVAKIAK